MRVIGPTIAVLVFLFSVQPVRTIWGQTPQTNDLASWTIEKVIRDANNNKTKKALLKYRELSIEKEYETNGSLRSTKTNSRVVDGSKKYQVAGFELDLYELLANTYNFRLANTGSATGLTVIEDRVYVVIDFVPKPGLRFKNLSDRFVQRLRGRIWVDVHGEHYYILKMEAGIPEGFGFDFIYWNWGVIPIPITIKSLRIKLNQERLGSEQIVVEKSAEATVVFDSLRDGKREYKYTYDNFERMR